MFDETLLESSPSKVSVLKTKHWLISLAIGVVVFCALYFGLGAVSFGDPKVILAQASIVAVLITGYALMFCYVVADAKHLGLSPWTCSSSFCSSTCSVSSSTSATPLPKPTTGGAPPSRLRTLLRASSWA